MARLLAQMFNTAFHPRAVACHARRLMVAVVACLALASCAVNPATGERNLMLLSESQEAAMGAQEHPKLVKAFGGTYDDPAITAYVNEIGQKLVSVSEYADRKFTFTVVDSPIVNAFALPGGYVYVTRGLLALAQDEAELAGVLAMKSAMSPPATAPSASASRCSRRWESPCCRPQPAARQPETSPSLAPRPTFKAIRADRNFRPTRWAYGT